MNDDPALKNVDIYQRIQNNWLGEYRIPINALLTQQKVFELSNHIPKIFNFLLFKLKMDAVFELNTPKLLIGYKRPTLENVSTSTETNVMIEQFPEIKESIRLWCYITLEPHLELPTVNAKCLECSELLEVRQHLNNWSLMAMEMQPEKFMAPLICTSEGKLLCCTRLLQALAPPIEASENLLNSACRFVSLLATPKYYDPCMNFSGVWLSNQVKQLNLNNFIDLQFLFCS